MILIVVLEGSISANLWLNDKFLGWYVKFLLENPVIAMKMAIDGLLYGNQPPVLYGATLSMLPLSIESVFFGDSKSNLVGSRIKSDLPLNYKVNAPLLFWMITFVLLIFLNFISRRNHLSVNNSGIFVLVAASPVFSAFLTVLVCPSEHFKLTIQM